MIFGRYPRSLTAEISVKYKRDIQLLKWSLVDSEKEAVDINEWKKWVL